MCAKCFVLCLNRYSPKLRHCQICQLLLIHSLLLLMSVFIWQGKHYGSRQRCEFVPTVHIDKLLRDCKSFVKTSLLRLLILFASLTRFAKRIGRYSNFAMQMKFMFQKLFKLYNTFNGITWASLCLYAAKEENNFYDYFEASLSKFFLVIIVRQQTISDRF